MNDQNLVKDDSLNVKEAIMRKQEEEQKTSYEHGEYVPGEDGEPGGILIDHDEEFRKATMNPKIQEIENYIANMDDMIESAKQNELNSNLANSEEKMSEQQILDRAADMMDSSMDPQMQAEIRARREAIKKVSDAFSEFHETANGLEPVDAPAQIPQTPVIPEPQVAPTSNVNSQPTPVEPTPVDNNIVQFNVNSEDADRFLTNLNPEERSKVVKSDTIIINEVKTLDIPVATRTITSMNEFKRVLPRQSHSGVVKTPNINSGYSASFKGCGALALATIVPDETGVMDYAKRFKLCYDNLVDTSIGKLSFNDFCARTHINDLPNMLFAILRASDPDENLISLECAGCGKTYEQKYKLSQLLDVDSISDEMNERINTIMSNEGIYENAMNVHNASPIMTPKYIQFDQGYQKVVVELKSPNGTKFIELTPYFERLIEKYSRFVAGLLPYISSVYLTFTPEGTTKEETYHITDVDVIAEIIRDLDKSCIQALAKVLEDVKEYPAPTYSFKGTFKCPHCGRVEEKIPCTVDNLIFYRVEQAIL